MKQTFSPSCKARLGLKHQDLTVVVFSDAHYWPGVTSTAHRALLRLLPEIMPDVLIANGDILDGARISKHSRIGWESAPRIEDELETCRERLAEIATAATDGLLPPICYWTMGNHDARFENYLSNNAPEMHGVKGTSLKDHFPPIWQPCWSLCINDNTIIKHRWQGGRNATLKNVLESGVNIVTGHLHSGKVSPYTDYNGTRFGVDCGTLADPYGPQFINYTEDNCVDWRSGFTILNFRKGELLWPEFCHIIKPGVASFRGKLIEV